MKKMVYVLVLFLMVGFSCKKKEPAAESAPPPEKAPMAMEHPAEAPESAQAGSMLVEYEIVPAEGPVTSVTTYTDGANSRMEMYQGEGANKKLVMIHIMNGGDMYMLSPDTKTATKMSGAMMQGGGKDKSPGPRHSTWKEWMDAEGAKAGMNVENKGAENWNGEDCTVYRATNTADKSYIDYYVGKSEMIKRIVSFDQAGKQMSDMRILKFEKNAAMPAGALDIPSDYQIQEMPKMPGMPR